MLIISVIFCRSEEIIFFGHNRCQFEGLEQSSYLNLRAATVVFRVHTSVQNESLSGIRETGMKFVAIDASFFIIILRDSGGSLEVSEK